STELCARDLDGRINEFPYHNSPFPVRPMMGDPNISQFRWVAETTPTSGPRLNPFRPRLWFSFAAKKRRIAVSLEAEIEVLRQEVRALRAEARAANDYIAISNLQRA